MNDVAGGGGGGPVAVGGGLDAAFYTRPPGGPTPGFPGGGGGGRHQQDAEDVAQEAFAKAYRRFSQLRDRDRFRAWLVRMTWRLAIDKWRAERRRATREQAVERPPSVGTTEEDAQARDRARHLWRA